MRVLIVGCGYIGTSLGCELSQHGHEVFGMRRSRTAEVALRSAGIRLVVADVAEPKTLEQLPGPFDWVVNTISSGHGGLEDYRTSYLNGTCHLLRWMGSRPPQRFLYTSSTGVYGQDDGSVVTESSPTGPSTPTGQILVETEQRLREAHAASGFPAMIMRVAGIYGPARTFFLRQILDGQARLAGDGGRFLNMVHRDDVTGAIRAALTNGRPGEIYNVVDDEPVTQLGFYEWMSKSLGRPLPEPATEAVAVDRKRGLTSKRVSNQKLKSELGFKFRFPTFREGYATLLPEEATTATSSPQA